MPSCAAWVRPPDKPSPTVASRRLGTPSSVNASIKQIADVMRRANYAGALRCVPEPRRKGREVDAAIAEPWRLLAQDS